MVLALAIEGPLQSWGDRSRFDTRRTLTFPTKSAILGMIDAALGIRAEDTDRTNKPHYSLRMVVYGFSGTSLLRDYHTVGGGENGVKVLTAYAHKKILKDSAVVSTREYLQSAKFAVLLDGDVEILKVVDAALRDPVYGIWFGRKCCPPVSPVSRGVFESEESAIKHLEHAFSVASDERVWPRFKVSDCMTTASIPVSVYDLPVSKVYRKFASRTVHLEMLDKVNRKLEL